MGALDKNVSIGLDNGFMRTSDKILSEWMMVKITEALMLCVYLP